MSSQPTLFNPYKRNNSVESLGGKELLAGQISPVVKQRVAGVKGPAGGGDVVRSVAASGGQSGLAQHQFLVGGGGVHGNTTEPAASGLGEGKKEFVFQLDPNFRMDMMKKRMHNKINITTDAPDGKTAHTPSGNNSNFKQSNGLSLSQQLQNHALRNKLIASSNAAPLNSNFIPQKKYSQGFVSPTTGGRLQRPNKAFRASLIANKPSPEVLSSQPMLDPTDPTTAKTKGIYDSLSTKQSLLQFLDNQKYLGVNRLKERKTVGGAIDAAIEQASANNSSLRLGSRIHVGNNSQTAEVQQQNYVKKGYHHGIEGRRAPINVVRDAVPGVSNAIEDDKDTLIQMGEDGPTRVFINNGFTFKDNGASLRSSYDNNQMRKTAGNDGSDIQTKINNSTSGFSWGKFFKRKASENQFERNASVQSEADSRRQRSVSRDVVEVKTQNYYMVALKYNYRKKLLGATALAFREHFYPYIGSSKILPSKKGQYIPIFRYRCSQRQNKTKDSSIRIDKKRINEISKLKSA
jgi:hypothetical protein